MTRFDADVARRLRWIQQAALQPGGRLVAVTVRVRAEDPAHEAVELWWHDLDDGSAQRVDGGAGASFADPAWSEGGELLAVRLLRDGAWRLALLAPGAEQAAPRDDLPAAPLGACAWDGDRRLALVLAREETLLPAADAPYRTRAEVWERDGLGRVDRAGSDLWELRLGEPGSDDELRRLTATPSAKSAPAWSPGGERLLYEDRALEQTAVDGATLQTLTVAGGAPAVAVAAAWRPHAAAWVDDATIAFAGTRPETLAGTQERLWVAPADGSGAPVDRTAGGQGAVLGFLDGDLPSATWWDPAPPLIDRAARTAIVRVHVGGACEVRRIALAGRARAELLLGGRRACHPCGVTADGELLALVCAFDRPPRLVLRDDRGGERTVADPNRAVLADVRLAPLRKLLRRRPDGVDAWFASPPQGGPGPWPAVAILHGGPHAASGHLFHLDAQLLLAEGIAVLFVNHRGSKGYDDAFGTALREGWQERAPADVLTAVDAAVACGWADPRRLGVHGQSAGGTLTCWLACRTGRFIAAAPENAATNFVSLLGSSDIGSQLLPDLIGRPDPGLRAWLAASPVADAHRCRTATLLIQAEADRRCPPEQGEQLYRLLRHHRCEAEMVRLPGGTHDASVLGPPPLREAQERAVTEWFVRHLSDRPAATAD